MVLQEDRVAAATHSVQVTAAGSLRDGGWLLLSDAAATRSLLDIDRWI